MTDPYAGFDRLLFDRPAPFVLRVTMNRPEKMNAIDRAMHEQVTSVWRVIDADPETRVTIITGAGRAFCAGGDMEAMPTDTATDPGAQFTAGFREAQGFVEALVDARKPIVSAINGAAVGAGLAIALLADIPIASTTAKLLDGHLRIGVLPGDHAALIWPLLCGMAKAKYFLMSNEPMTGEQAERCNLVALAVPPEELADRAVAVATKLSLTAPTALMMTKYVMNHWLRQNRPIFDLSAALEMANFTGREAREAMAAMAERRPPVF